MTRAARAMKKPYLILGAGLMGLSLTYELAKFLPVTLLDLAKIGTEGASSHGFSLLRGDLFPDSLKTLAEIQKICEDMGLKSGIYLTGYRSPGKSERLAGGYLELALYLQALKTLCLAAGAKVLEGVDIKGISRQGNVLYVGTTTGRHDAEKIFLCGGSSHTLYPHYQLNPPLSQIKLAHALAFAQPQTIKGAYLYPEFRLIHHQGEAWALSELRDDETIEGFKKSIFQQLPQLELCPMTKVISALLARGSHWQELAKDISYVGNLGLDGVLKALSIAKVIRGYHKK
ncbi:MAG: FAD-dependent oxidoreductase [Deinococcales bacterium]